MHLIMYHTTLCIPKVHCSITHKDIEQVITPLGLGSISKITFQNVTYHKTNCNKVYIHFGNWYNTTLMEHLKKGNSFKIIYNKPRFWICSLAGY